MFPASNRYFPRRRHSSTDEPSRSIQRRLFTFPVRKSIRGWQRDSKTKLLQRQAQLLKIDTKQLWRGTKYRETQNSVNKKEMSSKRHTITTRRCKIHTKRDTKYKETKHGRRDTQNVFKEKEMTAKKHKITTVTPEFYRETKMPSTTKNKTK